MGGLRRLFSAAPGRGGANRALAVTAPKAESTPRYFWAIIRRRGHFSASLGGLYVALGQMIVIAGDPIDKAAGPAQGVAWFISDEGM